MIPGNVERTGMEREADRVARLSGAVDAPWNRDGIVGFDGTPWAEVEIVSGGAAMGGVLAVDLRGEG